MRRTFATAIFALVAGCATQSALIPITYDYVDVPAEHRIEVAYRNTTGFTMCLLPEFWPNEAGKIN